MSLILTLRDAAIELSFFLDLQYPFMVFVIIRSPHFVLRSYILQTDDKKQSNVLNAHPKALQRFRYFYTADAEKILQVIKSKARR